MQQAFLALFMLWFFDTGIFDAIAKGDIAYELTRPLDLYWRWFCQSAAIRLSKAALRCMPILIVAFILPHPLGMSLPESGLRFILFLVSALLALCVVVSFSMLVYISTFYTLSPMGVRIVAASIGDFLAGAIIPLPFFPQPFRSIAELLPFASMQNMPLRIYSGNIEGVDAFRGIALQLFWLGTLTLTGRLLMKKALSKVIVQGG